MPKLSGTEVYRSYLSLLPDEEESTDEPDSNKMRQINEERQKILAHFQTLSGQEQSEQRKIWSKELSQVEKEIADLKIQIQTHETRRNHLMYLLGIDLMKKVKTEAKKSVTRLTKELRDFLQSSTSDAPSGASANIENNNAKEVAKSSE